MAKIGTIQLEADTSRLSHLLPANRTPPAERHWPMNKNGRTAEILIYQEIGYWYDSRMFIDQLNGLGEVDVIDVRINSVGGIAQEAVAMYQALVRHAAKKRVWIDAAAYSAASLLAMAASPGELRIAFNARMMIHNAWNIILGDKREMAKEAELLDMLDGTIAATYAKRMTSVLKEEILGLMDEETWYDAEGAVAAGLADEIFEGDEAVDVPGDATNLASRYRNIPRDLVDRLAARGQKVEGRASRVESRTSGEGEDTAVEVAARWAEVRERETA